MPAQSPHGVNLLIDRMVGGSPLARLAHAWKLLAFLAAMGGAAGAAIATGMPAWYEARVQLVVIPVNDPINASGINAVDSANTALSMLSAVLHSRSLADAVATRFDLASVYGMPQVERASAALGRHISINSDRKANLITIAVEDQSPRRAKELTAAVAELAMSRTAELWLAGSREERLKLEVRFNEVAALLGKAEDAMRKFREENRVIDLAEQVKMTVTQAANLERVNIEKNIGLAYARGFGAANSLEVLRSRQESAGAASAVAQIAHGSVDGALLPLDKLPRLEIDQARLKREIDVNATRYELLSREIEQLRMLEARPGGRAELIDPPIEPRQRVRPQRSLLTVEGALCSLLFGSLFALLRGRRAPDEHEPSGEMH